MKIGYNCFLFDYEVEYQNNLYSIHTFSAGDPDLEILVLLHGFAISNVHYCRVYKELSQKFRIFSIDLPGMGYSSKENIKITTKEEAIDFFLGMISKFILELFPGRKVIVGGHSFGGYLATHLLIRYPELFQQLYLLSPAGMTHYDANQIKELQDTIQSYAMIELFKYQNHLLILIPYNNSQFLHISFNKEKQSQELSHYQAFQIKNNIFLSCLGLKNQRFTIDHLQFCQLNWLVISVHQGYHFSKGCFSILFKENGMNNQLLSLQRIFGMAIFALICISKKGCICQEKNMIFGKHMSMRCCHFQMDLKSHYLYCCIFLKYLQWRIIRLNISYTQIQK